MSENPSFTVIGAGGVGPAIAHEIARAVGPRQVTLVDQDLARLASVRRRPGLEKVKILPANIGTDSEARMALIEESVAISAVPARFNPALAHRAMELGVAFCDLGGDRRITERMREKLDTRARQLGISIVPDCGLAPGLTDICAVDIARRGATDITAYVGGLPQRPRAECANYQRTFSLEGLLLLLEPAQVLIDGKVTIVEPFDELETLNVPALERFATPFGGRVEAFTTDGAGTAAWGMEVLGVRNFREKTVRWPGFVDFIRSVPRDQLLPALERMLPLTGAEHPDLVWMRVIGRGNGKEMMWELLDTFDGSTGFSSMARTTGFSAAHVALAVAAGDVRAGVHPPEEALHHEAAPTYLEKIAVALPLKYSERTL